MSASIPLLKGEKDGLLREGSSWAYRFAGKPANMLIFFTLASAILYIDRGAIASTGVNGSLDTLVCAPLDKCVLVRDPHEPARCVERNMTMLNEECILEGSPAHGFQGDFNMSSTLDGWIQSMFLVGLLVASPIFAQAAKTRDNIKLCGVGLLLWSVAVCLCGFTFDFWSLTICRTFVGIGEASLITIVPNFIDTCSPPGSKAKWLAIYCIAIPTGTALGYVYGGLIAHFLSWRFAFYIEAIIMFPMLCFTFMVETSSLSYWPQHRAQNTAQLNSLGLKGVLNSLAVVSKDLSILMSNPVYVLGMFGYSAYCAMMGIFAYWGPKSGQAMHADVAKYGSADTVFGMLTVVSGIIGTFLGGFMLDKIGVSVSSALLFCASMTLVGTAILVAALYLSVSIEAFMFTLMLGFIIIFAIQGPINVVSMWTTPHVLRPFACAMYTVAIHVLGDVPSAPAAGYLHDMLYRKYMRHGDSKAESDSKAWNITLIITTLAGFLSVALWLFGWVVEKVIGKNRQRERRNSSDDGDEEGYRQLS